MKTEYTERNIHNNRHSQQENTLHFLKHTNHTAIYTVNPYYKVNPEPQLQGKNPSFFFVSWWYVPSSSAFCPNAIQDILQLWLVKFLNYLNRFVGLARFVTWKWDMLTWIRLIWFSTCAASFEEWKIEKKIVILRSTSALVSYRYRFNSWHLNFFPLTLIVLMWRIGWAHNNARK